MVMKFIDDRNFFTDVKETAKIFGVSESTIYRWFWEGKLRGNKIGNKISIDNNSIEKLELSIGFVLREVKNDTI
jgi:excisionase family DNA binding protein